MFSLKVLSFIASWMTERIVRRSFLFWMVLTSSRMDLIPSRSLCRRAWWIFFFIWEVLGVAGKESPQHKI